MTQKQSNFSFVPFCLPVLLATGALSAAITSAVAAQVPSQQVSYWPLDVVNLETSTRDVLTGTDHALVGYPATYVLPEGRRGRGLGFDGSGQYVDVGAAPLFPRTQGTATFWARPASNATGVPLYESDSPDGEPIDYNGFGSSGDLLEIHFGSSSNWRFYYQDGVGSQVNSGSRFEVSGGAVMVGTWTHVAASWDRTGDMVLYVNCQEVDRVSMAGGAFSDHDSNEAFLGRPSEGGRFYDGELDEVRVFDRVLSDQEVARFCSLSDRQATLPLGPQARLADIDATEDWLVAGRPLSSTVNGDTGALELRQAGIDVDWGPSFYLMPQFAAPGDRVGASMSLDGNYLAAGTGSLGAGRPVWIWEYTQTIGWVEVEQLNHPNSASYFGESLSLSGDTLAIAVPFLEDERGEVRIVRRNSSGDWLLEQTIEEFGRGLTSAFATAVALEGDLLAVRGFSLVTNGSVEFVQIFRRSGTTWQFEATIAPSLPEGGNSIVMQWNQGRLVLGLESAPVDDSSNAGRVLIYEHEAGGGGSDWVQTAEIVSPIPTRNDGFGHRVALSGDFLAVSAESSSTRLGTVYLYRSLADGTWAHHSVLQPPQTDRWRFGSVLHATGDRLFVGAPSFFAELGGRGFQFSLPIAVFADDFEGGGVQAWSNEN